MLRGLVAIAAVCIGLLLPPQVLAQRAATGQVMGAAEAHAKALAGEVVLVDVRTPEEWAETGVPASAHAVTMHQDGRAFVAGLSQALGGDTTRPLAIICRSGNRTSAIYADLRRAGFSGLINVAEGISGGPHGAGWLKAGLPMRPQLGARMSVRPKDR
jgi:rhodanese-related sulfurtransferase